MAKKPTEFMSAYKIGHDEVWEVRAGGTWAVKHSALERVAAEQGIVFDPPTVIEAHGADKIATLLVAGKLKDRMEWSIGEAAPHNCKNAYTFAMAEKRAKDRVTLKLLNSHGVVYSDAEADDFAQANGKPTNGANGGDTITEDQMFELVDLCEAVGADRERFCKYLKVPKLRDLPATRFAEAKSALDAKREKVNA